MRWPWGSGALCAPCARVGLGRQPGLQPQPRPAGVTGSPLSLALGQQTPFLLEVAPGDGG